MSFGKTARKAACVLMAGAALGTSFLPAGAQVRKRTAKGKSTIQPARTGAWLYKQISTAASATANRAQADQAADVASTWRSWAAIYGERANMVPAGVSAAGLASRCIVHLTNVVAAARANNDEGVATLAASELRMWRSLALQLAGRAALTVNLPAEFLVPIPGLPGTPWAKSLAAIPPADTVRIPVRPVAGQAEASESPALIKLEDAPAAPQTTEASVAKDEPVRIEARPEMRYAILGAVGKPGNFLFEKMSVRMAIETAGGLLKSADKGKVIIRRGMLTDPANSHSVQYEYKKVADGKAPDLELLPGDVIEVPVGSPKRGFFDKLFTGAKRLIAPALPF